MTTVASEKRQKCSLAVLLLKRVFVALRISSSFSFPLAHLNISLDWLIASMIFRFKFTAWIAKF